jgi:hypothetical protein
VIAKRLARLASMLVAAMLSVLLLGVGATAAKTPNWSMTVTTIPTTVSPGAYAAFQITIANGGSSNIAKLFLTSNRSDVPFAVSPSTGCTAGPLSCSLGALGSGKSVTRTVVYKTSAAASSFDVTFQANTSGATSSDGGTSHGDTLTKSVSMPENGSGNFAGGYAVDSSSFSTGGGDSQQTTVVPPATGIGVTITESGGGNPCGSGTPIGQLSTINVGNGATFGPFLMTLTIQASSLPDELELGQVKVCHLYDNGNHVYLPPCSLDTAQAAPCFFAKWGGAHHPDREEHRDQQDADDWGLLILDVFDVQNGGLHSAY